MNISNFKSVKSIGLARRATVDVETGFFWFHERHTQVEVFTCDGHHWYFTHNGDEIRGWQINRLAFAADAVAAFSQLEQGYGNLN